MSQGLHSSLLHNPLRKTTLCLLLLLCPRHLLPKTHVVTHHVLMTSKWESSTLASQTRLTRERLQRHPDHQLCLYLSLYQRRCRTKGLPTYVTLCTSVMKRIAVSLINHHNSRLVRLRTSVSTMARAVVTLRTVLPMLVPRRSVVILINGACPNGSSIACLKSQASTIEIHYLMRGSLMACPPARATFALKKTSISVLFLNIGDTTVT